MFAFRPRFSLEYYDRPALRNSFAALPAASKVACASFAVMPTVVSMSDRLPPAAAARIADAAAFSFGNSPMAHPIMAAEGQIPPDEVTSNALEQLGNSLLTIFRLGQHAFDGVGRETTTRDVDWHGISPAKPLPSLKLFVEMHI
jgi:hypothetical protein